MRPGHHPHDQRQEVENYKHHEGDEQVQGDSGQFKLGLVFGDRIIQPAENKRPRILLVDVRFQTQYSDLGGPRQVSRQDSGIQVKVPPEVGHHGRVFFAQATKVAVFRQVDGHHNPLLNFLLSEVGGVVHPILFIGVDGLDQTYYIEGDTLVWLGEKWHQVHLVALLKPG